MIDTNGFTSKRRIHFLFSQSSKNFNNGFRFSIKLIFRYCGGLALDVNCMTVDVRYTTTGEPLKLFSSSPKDESFGQKICTILMKCQEVLYRIIHAMLFSNNMPFPVFSDRIRFSVLID